ncbi:4747_t:CDS:2, partial [Racocetra fulgida]
ANIEKKQEVAVKQLQMQVVVISSKEYIECDSEKNAVKKCKNIILALQTPENQIVADEPDLNYLSKQANVSNKKLYIINLIKKLLLLHF